jgi:hypothetical protein
MGPVEWVRSVFGARLDLRSGKEELTVGAISLIEGLEESFTKAGITNAISLLVDKRVVYLDQNDVDDDLKLVGKAAQEAGILDEKFTEMHLVLTHKEAGLHTIIDVRIQNEVILGQEEMQILLSSRVEELRIRAGETADAYGARIKAFAEKPEALEVHRHSLDALTERVGAALRGSIVGGKVTVHPAIVEIIRPDAPQIARFRNLGFGDDVSEPAYRPVPTMQRHGAYADPYYYYYYDPYYDFMSWMMVSSMMHSMAWHYPHVHVVDPGGHLLYTGDVAHDYVGNGWAGESVTLDQGGVHVPDTMPATNDSYLSDLQASSYGTSDTAGTWDHGGSHADTSGSSCSSASSCSSSSSCSTGSSCSSGSSCGSSCSSGSSCGSSCGGGSD